MRALQGGLPSRIVALVPTLRTPTATELRARLPPRLSHKAEDAAGSAWLSEVGGLLALHAAKERCEALGVLVLLRYMPLHHTSHPESLDPVSQLLTSHGSAAVVNAQSSEGAPSAALYALLAGAETASVGQLLATLAPLLESRAHLSRAVGLAGGTAEPTAAALAAWETREEQLATLALMAAMHGEKEFCQLHSRPTVARTAAAHERHEQLTQTLLNLGRAACRGQDAPGGSSGGSSALGALLIVWCVVLLEVAPEEYVSELAGEVAVAGEQLRGLSWGIDLFHARGFRPDDPPEELSSIARQLHFDLIAGMLSQQRFRTEPSHAVVPLGANPADTGWPPHSEELLLLMAAVLEGRPALCRTFWSDPDFLADGSLSSMLLNGRYPLRSEPLPRLLAALCADAESASLAWAFAHALPRVCHNVPRQFNLFGVRPHGSEQLRTEVRTPKRQSAKAPKRQSAKAPKRHARARCTPKRHARARCTPKRLARARCTPKRHACARCTPRAARPLRRSRRSRRSRNSHPLVSPPSCLSPPHALAARGSDGARHGLRADRPSEAGLPAASAPCRCRGRPPQRPLRRPRVHARRMGPFCPPTRHGATVD